MVMGSLCLSSRTKCCAECPEEFNLSNFNTPICFYHGADNDGKLAGAIVKLAYEKAGEDIVMYPWDYGQPFPWDKVEGREVVMVDIALQPFSEHLRLAEVARELIWIDHHKSAIDSYVEAVKCVLPIKGIRAVGIAACELAWLYYNRGPVETVEGVVLEMDKIPQGVRLVGRYDVWDHSDPDALPFKYGLDSCQIDPSRSDCNWMALRALINGGDWTRELLCRGLKVHAYVKTDFKKYAESAAFETVLDGHKVIALNRLYGGSHSVDPMFVRGTHAFMVAFGYTPKSNGKWTVSMYSDEGIIDLGAIAKKFGGGGHMGAAGFQIGIDGIQQLCAGELKAL